MLIESVKKHDTKKNIKLVSIDNIRNKNYDIINKIHSVPALMFLPTKEIIFGKAVFDYLLLPNRGYLFSNLVNTRDNKDTNNSSINSPIPINNTEPSEPMSFTLGSISSEIYSDINDESFNFTSTNTNSDKVYKWTIIDENNNSNNNEMEQLNKKYEEQKKIPLPSLDELEKQRNSI